MVPPTTCVRAHLPYRQPAATGVPALGARALPCAVCPHTDPGRPGSAGAALRTPSPPPTPLTLSVRPARGVVDRLDHWVNGHCLAVQHSRQAGAAAHGGAAGGPAQAQGAGQAGLECRALGHAVGGVSETLVRCTHTAGSPHHLSPQPSGMAFASAQPRPAAVVRGAAGRRAARLLPPTCGLVWVTAGVGRGRRPSWAGARPRARFTHPPIDPPIPAAAGGRVCPRTAAQPAPARPTRTLRPRWRNFCRSRPPGRQALATRPCRRLGQPRAGQWWAPTSCRTTCVGGFVLFLTPDWGWTMVDCTPGLGGVERRAYLPPRDTRHTPHPPTHVPRRRPSACAARWLTPSSACGRGGT